MLANALTSANPLPYNGVAANGFNRSSSVVERAVTSVTTTTTVDISGGSGVATSRRSTGVDAYKQVEAVAPVAEPTPSVNPYANVILSSIELQLQRDLEDGASQEQLQSRLEAGLKGFEDGYNQAFKELSEAGLLDDSVKSAIQETFSQVQNGIGSMAEKFGLVSPVSESELTEVASSEIVATSSPAQALSSITSTITTVEERFTQSYRDLQTIKNLQKLTVPSDTYEHLKHPKSSAIGTSYSYSVAETRDFSFKLRTQDGDVVTVNISNAQAGRSSLQMPRSHGDEAGIGVVGTQNSNYQLDINGELDASELDAIGELLAQVGDISELFYSGAMDDAVAMASSISFDAKELSGFNLSLGMSSSEQVTETKYGRRGGGVADRLNEGFQRASIEPFITKVRHAGELAERIGQPQAMIPDLLSWVGKTHHSDDSKGAMIGPMAKAAF